MKRATFATGLALVPVLASGARAQASVNVVIDGQPVVFDQPPIEQAGRLYVPLRGVFERLGASVVYENGRINATSGAHRISLTIGSTQALVDGTPRTLDAPPFTIAGRTLVPLRFISESLGASVDYQSATNTVTITSRSAPSAPQRSFMLLRDEPASGGTSDTKRPEISASFSMPVDPNTLEILFDGRDVTAQAYLNDRSFSYVPSFDVPVGRHTVGVAGRTRSGETFRREWSFTTRTPAPLNFLSNVQPQPGTRVGGRFTVTGSTRPFSRLTVIAVANARVAGFDVNSNGSRTVVQADSRGFFRANLSVLDMQSGVVDVRIDSQAPDGGRVVRTIRLRT